jgi:2,4-dienoyl-CoA reductase-like NADH-dependent reductase (Old Yellow Enzyme family)
MLTGMIRSCRISDERTDEWGGDIAKRVRLMLESHRSDGERLVMDRVAVRLAPSTSLYDLGDSKSLSTFASCGSSTIAKAVGRRKTW